MAGRAAPDDVGDCAEAGHRRSGGRRGVRRQGRNRPAPGGAVSADGGRHSRHQPAGLERLEGEAARGPVPRRRAQCWTEAARGSARPTAWKRGAPRPHASCACTRCRRAPKTELWQRLDIVYFQRHSADDIAWHARQLYYRVDGQQAGRQGAARARRRRAAGDGLSARPEGALRAHLRLSSAARSCRFSKRRSIRRGTATRSTPLSCTIRRTPTPAIARRSATSSSSCSAC